MWFKKGGLLLVAVCIFTTGLGTLFGQDPEERQQPEQQPVPFSIPDRAFREVPNEEIPRFVIWRDFLTGVRTHWEFGEFSFRRFLGKRARLTEEEALSLRDMAYEYQERCKELPLGSSDGNDHFGNMARRGLEVKRICFDFEDMFGAERFEVLRSFVEEQFRNQVRYFTEDTPDDVQAFLIMREFDDLTRLRLKEINQ